MTERPLDLRQSVRILRRRWLLIVALATLGLFAGLTHGLLVNTRPRAFALVYVPPQTNSSGGVITDDMSTQTVIASSTRVLGPAIHSLSPPASKSQVKVTVTADGTTNILRISTQAPKPQQTIQLANAIANGYIAYASSNSLVTSTPLLVQPASTADSPSTTKRLATSVPIGLAAGLIIGTTAVFIRSRRDRRLRRRDEIANAIGLPVLASIDAGLCKRVSDWTRLLEQYRHSPTALWNLRRALQYLLSDEPAGAASTIRVAAYADDLPALAAGPQLALAAAELQISARVEPGMEEALAPLRAACAQLTRSGHIPPRPWRHRPTDLDPRQDQAACLGAPSGHPLVISVLALDRSAPHWSPFGGPSILAISAGAALSDELASLALAASEQGGRLDGIILVNPEPGDGGATVVLERPQKPPSPRHRLDNKPNNRARVLGDAR